VPPPLPPNPGYATGYCYIFSIVFSCSVLCTLCVFFFFYSRAAVSVVFSTLLSCSGFIVCSLFASCIFIWTNKDDDDDDDDEIRHILTKTCHINFQGTANSPATSYWPLATSSAHAVKSLRLCSHLFRDITYHLDLKLSASQSHRSGTRCLAAFINLIHFLL